MKRVIILGGSGFVGSHLTKHLKDAGTEAIPISSTEIDLSSPDAIRLLSEKVSGEDTLIFASCITREKGEDLPTFMKNLSMASAVGQFVEKNGVGHLIYISSDAVYRDGISLINEESERSPSGLYGMTHVAREQMVTHATTKGKVPLLILRPSAIYGRGDTHNGYGPNRFLKTAISQGKITLFGGGEEKRDHIFVEDLCRLIELCLHNQTTGILNLSTGQAVSFDEVARTVVKVLNREVKVENLPRQSPITHRHFDVTALLKKFPTFSFTTLEEGLRRSV